MKKILKAIGFGIVLGATMFFVPFIFKFILIAMVIGMVARLFAYRKRRHFMERFAEFEPQFSGVVPIDNQWYKPTIQGDGQLQYINVNYYEHESI